MNRLYTLIVFFLGVFLIGIHLVAAPARQDSIFPVTSYIHFGEEQGLTTKTVYSIIQDNEGFIWMGTDAGVFRFDGKKFKQFTTKDGITDNEVLHVYQDRLHRIWFLPFNGHLSFWKDGKIHNPQNTPFLQAAYTGGAIRSVFEDTKGRLWLGTERKGFIQVTNSEIKVIQTILDGTISNPNFIHEDFKGDLWTFVNRKTMFKILVKNFTDTIYLPISQWNFSCHPNNKYFSYVATPEGVLMIRDWSATPYIQSNALPSWKEINNIVANEETIWICTNKEGCYEYKRGNFTKRYLNNLGPTFVLKDREGSLWFCVMNKGVFMLPAINNSSINFNQSTGLSGEKVLCLAGGNKNSVWVGYDNGVVDCINGNEKVAYNLNTILKSYIYRVTSLLFDSERTWCGTDAGIFLIQNKIAKYVPIVQDNGPVSPYSVKRLLMDEEGRIYATSNANLMQVCKGPRGYFAKEALDFKVRTFSGIEYKRNDFLIASTNGLIEWIPGVKNVEFKTDADFSSIRILDMKSDSNHLIYLATIAGLYTMRDGKIIQHFSGATGLSDDNCNRVCISGDHRYVATSNGLNILEKKDNVWRISEAKTIQNGLLSNSINDVMVNGDTIYAGTDDGLSIIKKTDSVPNIYVGRVSVTELSTDSTFMVSGNTFSCTGDIPRLVIRFAYPVFNPVNSVRVKYRLLDNKIANPQWHYSQNNSVEFSSLNPGNYIFQLKPDINQENNLNITNFYLNIKPLWWQTTTAKVFFSLSVIGLVALFFAQRTKRRYEFRVAALKQMNMVDKERSRIASDMHDDIGADLTKISMMANIAKVSTDKGDELIRKIAQTSNEVLRKIDHIIWTLDSAHDYLPDLIYFINERTSKYLESSGIKFSFKTLGELPNCEIAAVKRRNISLVIKELVHNSVKHSGASTIEIKVYHVNSQLNIIYEENGKGYVVGEITNGLGQTTLRKRMEEIDSTIDISSGKGKGVFAHLIIPVLEDNSNQAT